MDGDDNSINNLAFSQLSESLPPLHSPNFIRNAENEESFDPSIGGDPVLRTQTNVRSKLRKVVASDLRNFVKSKEDLYIILTIEGQLNLPPYDECTMEFMRDALSGKKKLISNRELAVVNVPRYKEFNATNLYKAAVADVALRVFLPDITSGKSSKTINRKFLFNVSVSLLPIKILLGYQYREA